MINDRMDAPIAEPMIGDTTDEAFRRKVFDHMCAKHGAPASACRPPRSTAISSRSRSTRSTGNAVMYPIDNFRLLVEVNLIAPVYWAMEMVARIAEERQDARPRPVGAARGHSGHRHLHRVDLVAGDPRPGRLRRDQGRARGSRGAP